MIAPHVDTLASRTQESTYCVIFHHGEAVYLYESLPSRELHVSSRVGRRLSPFQCLEGKAVLVAQDEATLKTQWQAARASVTGKVPSWSSLQRDLRAFQPRGYVAQCRDDIQMVVAPILRDQPPLCHAALVLCGPAFRLRHDHLRTCTNQLLETVGDIGRAFGTLDPMNAIRKSEARKANAS
jgi:DNA-binding IclR family transcriptional regulator